MTNPILGTVKARELNLSTDKINIIVYGDPGVGKTCLIETCPTPVLIHNFDTGGLLSIKDWIACNPDTVIAEDFSYDDPTRPTAWRDFEKRLTELKKGGVFERIKFYCVDSLTGFGDACLNQILYDNGMIGKKPTLAQYQDLQIALRFRLQEILSLPCNVLFTAHCGYMKNDITGDVRTMIFISGQMELRVPMMFDELYHMQAFETSKGINRTLLIKSNGTIKARSRLGRVIEDARVPANITELMVKLGALKKEDQPMK